MNIFIPIFTLFSCTSAPKTEQIEPTFIYVEMEGDVGSAEEPLAFTPISCKENEDVSCITFCNRYITDREIR